MITTIQIHEDVKKELDRLKDKKQTYEEVILKMIEIIEKQKRKQELFLIKGCKEMAEESLKITKEFDKIQDDLDWEW